LKKIEPNMIILNERKKQPPLDLDEDHQVLVAAMADVSMALNSSLHLDEVLDNILENLAKVVSYKTANIMLLEGSKAKIVRCKGYEVLGTKEMIMSRTFDTSELDNYSQIISSKQPILSYYPHLEQDWHLLAESEWIKSHIASPILSDNEVIGFLNCDSDIAGFFNKVQTYAMQIFANQVGLAIRNAKLFDASTRLGKKLRSINDLTRQVLEATTLNQIFDMLPEKLMELLEGTNVYISKWDENSQTVTGWAATGKFKEEYIYGKSDPGDRTLTKEILETQHSTVIENLEQSQMMESKFHGLYLEKSLFCLPLIAENTKFGAIIIGYSHVDLVTEDVRSLGEYAAMQISTAISKIHMLEQERIQSSQLTHANALIESLSHVSTAIKSGVDTNNIMYTIGMELELLRIHSLVALKIGETDNLSLTYSSVQSKLITFVKNFNKQKISDVITSIDALPLFREIIDTQQAEYLEHPEEILVQITPSGFKPAISKLIEALSLTKDTKCILIPLIIEKKSIGLLSLWGESLQKIDIQAASIFGGQVAIAIENAKLLQEVQRLAITDELTNVLNRRGFDEVANREFGAAKRYSRPLSLIMLDIDRFKAINDVYGHPIGDEILIEIAARARTKIRETDYISRYGGEEFLILLTEQKPDNAKTVAERIRKSVAEQPFNTSVGKITVTISIGVTGANSQISSISMMIKTVDKALYKSKENGRNRVTMIDKI
jgi:diguanylate cyclase (GGDEF)-like protein